LRIDTSTLHCTEKERLPLELGWYRPNKEITFDDLDNLLDRVVNATGASTEEKAMMIRGAGMHGGR